MVPSWADQLLPQLLMEQFDTLSIQCRHIEHMHDGVWFKKDNFLQDDSCENLEFFSVICLLYMPQLLMEQFDTLPIQCRHIKHMHEGVWFRENNI